MRAGQWTLNTSSRKRGGMETEENPSEEDFKFVQPTPARRIPEWVIPFATAVIGAVIPLWFLYDQSVTAKKALEIQSKAFDLQLAEEKRKTAEAARDRDFARAETQLYRQQFESAPTVFTTGLAK